MRACICGRDALVVESGRSICGGCGKYAIHCSCPEAGLLPITAPVVMSPALVQQRIYQLRSVGGKRPRHLAA